MYPVRSIITTLFLCSLPFYAAEPQAATSETEGSGAVEFALVESVEIHNRREDITRICRSKHEVKGCTDFPVESLSCHCQLHGGHWMIDARARVDAVIHLSRAFAVNTVLRHERLHLEDLEVSLREHLARISSTPYQSEKACKTYAKVLTESPHLRVVMNEIRVRSNKKYGCSPKGAN